MMIKYVQLKWYIYIYNDLTCVSDYTADNTHSDTINVTNCILYVMKKGELSI